MAKYLCIILMGILCPLVMQAQLAPPTRSDTNIPIPAKGKEWWSNPILKYSMMDSLNQRSRDVAGKPFLNSGPGMVPTEMSNKLLKGLNDSAQQQFFSYVNQSMGADHVERLKKGYGLLRDSSQMNRYLDSKLRGFYAWKDAARLVPQMQAGAYQNSFKGFTVTAFADNTPAAIAKTGFNIQLEDQLILGNIPFNIQYANLSGQSTLTDILSDQSLAKVSFDKDAYMKRMSKYVSSNYDLNKYFLGDIDVAGAVKSFATQRISEIQQEMQGTVNGGAFFKELISAEQLVHLDSNQIKQVLLSQSGLNLQSSDLDSGYLNVLKERAVSDSLNAELRERIQKVEAAQSYLKKIQSLKIDMGNGLAIKETLSKQVTTNAQVSGWLNDPMTKANTAKELLPLGFFQRLMLSAKSINIGNIAASGTKGSVSDLFMAGAQGSFLSNNNKFLMMGLGKRNDGAGIKDLPFSNSIAPSSFAMQFMQFGKGDVDKAHSHLGVVNANTKSTDTRQFTPQQLSRNIFVGAISQQLSVGEYGALGVELSKSSTSFNNSSTGNEYALSSKAAAFTLFNDFWQTLSAGIDFAGEVSEWRLTHRVYLNYAGLGYSNPATPYASRGSLKYGAQLKRSWQKNKIVVGVKMDMQDMSTSPLTNSKWKNQQVAIDARFKLKRNLSLTTQWRQAMMKSVRDNNEVTGFLTRQFTMSSQIGGKIFSLPHSSNVMLGVQQMDMTGAQSVLVNLNVNHSLVINANMLSFNLFYNRDIKNNALYGNLLTAESAWNYTLVKKVNCSSGATYLDNKDVVRQVGIKQTFNTNLLPKLNANLYLDCRKHLLNTPQNYLFGNFRSEIALHYLLN
jgi:hypothetical protein